jgi:phosphoglycolate phosphatase-like HAD superfamily hydrolase
MGTAPLLVLDFDGVICDSLPECYVSSWHAYHGLSGDERPERAPLDSFGRFSAQRPFIRSGEDYLLIQDLLSRGRSAGSQAEFDALVREAGPDRMARYKDALYRARETLLAESPDYWYRLNRIYPHMRDGLGRLDSAAEVYVLSTKRPAFIVKILEAAGLGLPADRVLYSGARRKDEMIRELMGARGAAAAAFVDDQVDHFSGSPAWPRERGAIDCLLATWGYVKPEWIRPSEEYRLLTPDGARELLGRYARRSGA